jgi:hypothetical protein
MGIFNRAKKIRPRPEASWLVNRQIERSKKMYGTKQFRRKFSLLGRFSRTWFSVMILVFFFSNGFLWLEDQGFRIPGPWELVKDLDSLAMGFSGLWVLVLWRWYNKSKKAWFGDEGIWPIDEDPVTYFVTYGGRDPDTGFKLPDGTYDLMIEIRECVGAGGIAGLPDEVSHGGGFDNPYFDWRVTSRTLGAGEWDDDEVARTMLKLQRDYWKRGGSGVHKRGAYSDIPMDFRPTIPILCKSETQQALQSHDHFRWDSTVYVADDPLPVRGVPPPMKSSDYDIKLDDAKAGMEMYRAWAYEKSEDALQKRQMEGKEREEREVVYIEGQR